MKLKKALSGILAAAMVVSLTPTMAFATTTNTISGVGTVAKNGFVERTVEIAVKGVATNWAGYDSSDSSYEDDLTFTLDNAKWAYGGITSVDPTDSSSKLSKAALDDNYSALTPGTIPTSNAAIVAKVTNKNGVTHATAAAIATYSSSNSVTLKISHADTLVDGDLIQITVAVKAGTSTGDVTLSMSSDDGDITSIDAKTIATVVSGQTKANVPDKGTDDLAKLAVRTGSQPTSEIQIKEVTDGCLGSTTTAAFSLTLPKEISWSKLAADTSSTAAGIYGKDADVSFSGTLFTAGTKAVIDPNNNRRLIVEGTTTGTTTARRTLTISPKVDVSKNADNGEVSVTLRGLIGDISDESGLIIGIIGDSSVSVYVDEEDFKNGEVPSLYSGLVYEDESPSGFVEKNVVITLEENNKDAFTTGKYIDFTFDKAVQISGTVNVKVDGTSADSGLDGNKSVALDKNRNTFGWKVTGVNSSTEETVKVYVPITVEAGFEGDIVCTVSGEAAGVAESQVTVATAKPVIKVETTPSEVRNGVQKQAINDIVITETEIGSLTDSIDQSGMTGAADLYKGNNDNTYSANTSTSELVVEFPFALDSLPTVEVTDGDLDIEDVAWGNDHSIIKIEVKGESVKAASTITISDIKVTLTRVEAEGGYDIQVYGSAVLQNAGFGKDKVFADSYMLEDYVNIITPADSTTVSEKVQAAFVIGEASYTNNGAATEMDAAPYIDSHNRTMVPIRYVANACGISENDIRWEQNTQTAIINGLNTVVTVKMGSNKLQTSTGEITMDTAAVNNNGRIYVPVRYIANALGANVSWDAATKTVTLTK